MGGDERHLLAELRVLRHLRPHPAVTPLPGASATYAAERAISKSSASENPFGPVTVILPGAQYCVTQDILGGWATENSSECSQNNPVFAYRRAYPRTRDPGRITILISAHPWSPSPPRRARPGPGRHTNTLVAHSGIRRQLRPEVRSKYQCITCLRTAQLLITTEKLAGPICEAHCVYG